MFVISPKIVLGILAVVSLVSASNFPANLVSESDPNRSGLPAVRFAALGFAVLFMDFKASDFFVLHCEALFLALLGGDLCWVLLRFCGGSLSNKSFSFTR